MEERRTKRRTSRVQRGEREAKRGTGRKIERDREPERKREQVEGGTMLRRDKQGWR